FKALSYIDAGEVPDPVGAKLRFQPSTLEFGAGTVRVDFTLTNISEETIDWSLTEYMEAGDNPGLIGPDAFYIPDGSPNFGTLAPGARVATAMTVDRSELTDDGNYQIHLIFVIDGGIGVGGSEELLLVRFAKTTSTVPSLAGPMLVAAYLEDESGALVTSGFQQSSSAIVNFDFEVDPGLNLLAAWSDKNDSGSVDDGDLFGYYPNWISVAPGERLTGLIVSVSPILSTSPDD